MKGIYKITSPSGRVYIGMTTDFDKRVIRYKYACNIKRQVKLYNSFVKYTPKSHTIELIEDLSNKDLEYIKDREIYFIDFYDSIINGLNCIKGGGMPPIQNKPMSQEQKDKISKANTGKKHSDETKKTLSERSIGKIQSKETIAKRVISMTGKESKLKGRIRPNISNKLKGRPSNNKTKTYCFIEDEKLIFDSVFEASVALGTNASSIFNNISNKTKYVKTNRGKIKFFRYE